MYIIALSLFNVFVNLKYIQIIFLKKKFTHIVVSEEHKILFRYFNFIKKRISNKFS